MIASVMIVRGDLCRAPCHSKCRKSAARQLGQFIDVRRTTLQFLPKGSRRECAFTSRVEGPCKTALSADDGARASSLPDLPALPVKKLSDLPALPVKPPPLLRIQRSVGRPSAYDVRRASSGGGSREVATLEAMGALPERPGMGHGPGRLQPVRHCLGLLPPRSRALAGLSLERGRPPRHLRPPPADLLRP